MLTRSKIAEIRGLASRKGRSESPFFPAEGEKLAGELLEADKKMLKTQEELQQVRFGREELRYELERVKAHAYDLMCGNRLNGEAS